MNRPATHMGSCGTDSGLLIEPSRRRLPLCAFAASLALHGAALLLVLRLAVPLPPPSEPIRLTLVGGGAPGPSGGPAAAAPPAPQAPAAPPLVAKAAPRQKPSIETRPQAAALQHRATGKPEVSRDREGASATAPSASAAAPAAEPWGGSGTGDGSAATGGGTGSGTSGGTGVGNLRAYCLSCPEPPYPRIALVRKWQGEVSVKVHIDPSGAVRDATIARSSGFPALDDAALAVARQSRFRVAAADGGKSGDIVYTFRLTARR